MKEILTNRDNLFKYGFCILRNLLDDKEIEQYRSAIKKISKECGQEAYIRLYNYRETWGYIVHDRLLNILKSLLGSKVFYLHSSGISHWHKISREVSWHRDSPCRIIGKGPDWDQNEPYNVVSVITYLSSNDDTKSGINVIPFSHKKNYAYTLSNILRILHWKTKDIKFLQGIRDKIQNYIGVTCRTDPGDCVVFLCNLFHDPVPTAGLRQAIIGQFGPAGKHSKNYVNYILKHREDHAYRIDESNKTKVDDFFNLLKSKNIFYPLPEKKEDISGVTISQDI
jgi:hypothetical protein